mgnify:CR=1 FL=1
MKGVGIVHDGVEVAVVDAVAGPQHKEHGKQGRHDVIGHPVVAIVLVYYANSSRHTISTAERKKAAFIKTASKQ